MIQVATSWLALRNFCKAENIGMSDRLVYSVKEAAQLLGLSLTGCYNCIAAGEIPAVRIGKRVVIPKARLEALLQGEKVAA
jgi:excisionase family DNA binding protein